MRVKITNTRDGLKFVGKYDIIQNGFCIRTEFVRKDSAFSEKREVNAMEKINKKTILYTIGVAILLVIAYYSRAFHTLSLILREILGGSMAVIFPKIAPKPYTKTGGSAICRE